MSTLMIPPEEACEELECSLPILRQWIAEGLIPAIQPGKAYRIPRTAFYEAINTLAREEAAARRRTKLPDPLPPAQEKRGRRGPRGRAASWQS